MRKKVFYNLLLFLTFSIISNAGNITSSNILTNAEYTISLDRQTINIAIGERTKLIPTVKRNGQRINFKDYKLNVTTDQNISILNEGADSIIHLIGMNKGEAEIKINLVGEKANTKCNVKVEKRTIKILAIGNSFSDDAIEHYLWNIAKADSIDLIIGNMYIGGCSLAKHVYNAENNLNSYSYHKIVNGERTYRENTNLAYVFQDEDWDYISLQEVSQQSGIYFFYEINLPKLVNYVQTQAPDATLMLHQTWAYAKDSEHSGFANYNNDQDLMYKSIVSAVMQAANLAHIDVIIPAGTAIQNGRTSSLNDTFCRDGYHLDISFGRYTASCTWFNKIFNRSVINNSYLPNFSKWRIDMARYAAKYAVDKPYGVTILNEFQETEPKF